MSVENISRSISSKVCTGPDIEPGTCISGSSIRRAIDCATRSGLVRMEVHQLQNLRFEHVVGAVFNKYALFNGY